MDNLETQTFAYSAFVRRQTKYSRFSYFDGEEAEVLRRTREAFIAGNTTLGYRNGVLLVSVDPAGFYSSTVQLRPRDKLMGTYEPRRLGEAPRKQVGVVGGVKLPAKAVQIILYHHSVLAEDQDASTDADWEIVSVNATPTEAQEPMTVGTLLANHFHVDGSNDGGTTTHMTDSELVVALRVSYEYWRDKATVAENFTL